MKYGTKGAMWAPMTKEGDAKTKPTYGEVKEFDGINEFTETLNMATGSAYGDNQEKLYISEFSNGEGTVKAVFIDAEVSAAILGTKKTRKRDGLRVGGQSALRCVRFLPKPDGRQQEKVLRGQLVS